MLLPHEINIRNKTFSRALNGYSQSEVNAFLDYIAGKYEELYSENIELSGKLEAVQKELDKYQKDEEKQEAEIRKLLFDAQRVAAAMIAEAEGKAQKIIADAENTAKEKLSASVKDQAINESTLSRLYSEAEAFRAQLISMYEARLRELKSETFTPLDSDAINNITAVSVNADSGSDTDDNIDDIDVNDDNNVADTPEYDAPEEDIEIDEDIETTESASDNVVAEYDEDNAERSFAENSSVEPSSAEQSAAEQPPEEISEEPISDEPLSQDIPAETVDSAYIHSYNEPQLNEEEPEPAEDNDVPATDALGADYAGSEDGAEIEEILCINGSADTDYSELTPSPYERPEGDVSAYDLYSADSIDDEVDEVVDNPPDNTVVADDSEPDGTDIEGDSSLKDTDSFEFVIVDDTSHTVPPVPTAQVDVKAGVDTPDIKNITTASASDTSDDANENASVDKDISDVVSSDGRFISDEDLKIDSGEGDTDTPFDDFTLDFLSQGADDDLAVDDEYSDDEIEDEKSSAAEEKDINTTDNEATDNATIINENNISDLGEAGNIENNNEADDTDVKSEINGIKSQLNGENDSNKEASSSTPQATDISNARRVYRIRRSFKYPRRYIDAANLNSKNTADNKSAGSNTAVDDDDLIEQLKQRYPESKRPADSSVSINKSFDEYDLLFGKK